MMKDLIAAIQFCQHDTQQCYQDFLNQYQILSAIPNMPICSMHHIGSTADENLQGRPIIDILIGLKTLHDVTNLDEKRMNYHHYYRIHRHLIKKVLYARFSEFHQLTQSHQLHIVEQDSDIYHQHLQFHNLICHNVEYRNVYQQYKQQLAIKYKNDVKQYNEKKQQFIQQLLNKFNHKKGLLYE